MGKYIVVNNLKREPMPQRLKENVVNRGDEIMCSLDANEQACGAIQL